MGEIVSRNM